MPLGIPFVVIESVVRFISFSGLTKLSTTRFTEGDPLPRSIIQWFCVSNVVMFGAAPQVQASDPQCQSP